MSPDFLPEAPPLRWGIIGSGKIAGRFAGDLQLLARSEVVAVGSRSQASAESFGERYDVPHRHTSYQALVADDDVQAVYVATPNPVHHQAAMLAIEAGKAVLVEKPFTLNSAEARSLVDAARARGVFLMEAMWTRFLPHMITIRELLAAGRLGDVRTLQADHGQALPTDPSHRVNARELGGGALLDLGVYPVSFSSMVLGRPRAVVARSAMTATGVDAQTSMVLEHEGGRHAVITATLSARTPNRASISGTDARIEIDSVWYTPTSFSVIDREGETQVHPLRHEGHGIRHQAAEVAQAVAMGRLESDIMPLDETVAIMATLDEVRSQIGLRYPGETG